MDKEKREYKLQLCLTSNINPDVSVILCVYRAVKLTRSDMEQRQYR